MSALPRYRPHSRGGAICREGPKGDMDVRCIRGLPDVSYPPDKNSAFEAGLFIRERMSYFSSSQFYVRLDF